MELKKCPEGHYYDATLYSECPTCQELKNGNGAAYGGRGGQGGGHTLPLGFETQGTGAPYGATAPVSGPVQGGYGATAPVSGSTQAGYGGTSPVGETAPLSGGYTAPLTGASIGTGARDEGQTIAVIHQQLGIDPVVGWLVTVSGPEKGRDYRIHSDNNYIGRGERMDICIRGDDTISRVNHAVIAYDTREKIFFFAPGEGRSINRVNGKAMLGTVILNPYDEIEIGMTKLIFVPFCGERFEWTSEDN